MFFLIFCAAMLLPLAARAQSSGPQPSVSSIRVHLFQNKTGTLSENILEQKDRELRNSFVGEKASSAALVVIEVSGPPRAVLNGFFGKKSLFHVRLTLRETRPNGRPIAQTQKIPTLGDDGKVYLGFWTVPGGCVPLHLVAVIPESSPSKPLSADLNFSCGD